MKFYKSHGLGNDFIIINCLEIPEFDYTGASRILCRRGTGIGADGLIVLLPSHNADFRMRIFNCDGSEAEMCGNGIRCLGKYIYDSRLSSRLEFEIETLAGVKKLSCHKNERGKISSVLVNMGIPLFQPDKIPVKGISLPAVMDYPMFFNDRELKINCLSMGNPHCVIFIDDCQDLAIEETGPFLENHSLFPERINVEFVSLLSEDRIKVKVWERGVGLTGACGTGACASAVIAMLKGYVKRNVIVELPGGELQVMWDKENFVHMNGEVEGVFYGELSEEIIL